MSLSNTVLLLPVNDAAYPDVKAYSTASLALILLSTQMPKNEHLLTHMEQKPQDFRVIKQGQSRTH